MPFNFELRFSGLIVFSFPDSKPSKGHALVVGPPGHHPHRASLAYRPADLGKLENDERQLAPDPLFTNGEGRRFASRLLDGEILTLSPSWPKGSEEKSLEVKQAPPDTDLNQIAEPWLDLVPNLSAIEKDRIMQPTAKDRDRGVRPDCLASPIPAGAPVIARLDFQHGVLRAGKLIENKTWKFVGKNGQPPTSAQVPPQRLASYVVLCFQGISAMTIKSTTGTDLNFQETETETVVASLTNEPERDFHPNGRYVDHFESLYRVVRWDGGQGPPKDVRVPHVDGGRTVDDPWCPGAVYAQPKP